MVFCFDVFSYWVISRKKACSLGLTFTKSRGFRCDTAAQSPERAESIKSRGISSSPNTERTLPKTSISPSSASPYREGTGTEEEEKDYWKVRLKVEEAMNLCQLNESARKHGDDWDLVSKNVQTKSKLECISKLMHLPFGDLMLGAGPRKGGFLDLISDVSNSKQAEVASNESLEYVKAEEPSSEVQNKDQQNGDANFCCWKLYDATGT
ncbi:hypothetical protein SASPL_154843 [Salvia splendens]|uniref:SANT domain-containing protein n=1 Tax=Salvia splendens TaxID=180675 RepID=A0A8X8W0T4_SALSN|nr:hypothetical protein SASPL_154843 [Salvia splendens]